MRLADEISALLNNVAQNIPPETALLMADATQRLRQTGITEHSCNKGDQIPDFTLPNAQGKIISSSALLEQGPLVINFYRGSW